jgi:foldase protein PrsA
MLNRRLNFFLVVILLAVISAAVYCAEQKPVQMELQTVIATVNGVPVTKDELYNRMLQFYPAQAQNALDNIVNDILISNEAAKKKVAVTDKDITKKAGQLGMTGALTPSARNAIKMSLLADKLITEEYNIMVTADDIKKFYDDKKDSLGEPEQFHLRQIFVVSEKDANDIMLALNAGADFPKMAAAKSLDTSSKEKGGDIGFFTKGMLVPEIEKIVLNLKPGDFSQPVKTDTGYHIIKFEGKKPAKAAKFDADMKKRLEISIMNSKIQEKLPGWLDGLRKKADIK